MLSRTRLSASGRPVPNQSIHARQPSTRAHMRVHPLPVHDNLLWSHSCPTHMQCHGRYIAQRPRVAAGAETNTGGDGACGRLLASGAVQSTTYHNPPESHLSIVTHLRGVGAGVGSTVGSTVGTGVGSTVGATVCTGVGGAKTCARCHFPFTYCTLQPRRPCQPPFTMCPVCGSRNGASIQRQMTIGGATRTYSIANM
jgi:hypothetical protein